MSKGLFLVIAAMAFAGLACGFATPPPTPRPTATPLPPVPAGTPLEDLDIKGFRHMDLDIKLGTVVTWSNLDKSLHTVTHFAPGGGERMFDSGHIAPDISFRWQFNEIGTFKYFCKLHPSTMVAIVNVTE